MSFANEWGKVFDKSILPFTGRNKVAVRELEDVVKGTTALVGSLAVIDKADPGTAKSPGEKKTLLATRVKEFTKVFQKEKVKYAGFLDKAISKTDKAMWPDAYRELKVLRAHLNWVESAIENQIVTSSKETQAMSEKASEAIKKKEKEIRKQAEMENKTIGESDQAVKEGTQFLKYAKLLVTFPTAAKTGAARALKAIKAVKADPTPATYNSEIDHGGRNYTQQMNNVIALTRDRNCPDDLRQELAGLVQYDAPLKEYGGGARRTVDQGTAPNVILQLIDQYSTLVKNTIGYIDVVSKYLAKNKKKLGLK
jgi:hypothetical protein